MKTIALLLFLFFSISCTKNTSQSNHKFLENHTHNKMAKTRGFLNVAIIEVKRDNDTVYFEATVSPNKDLQGSTIEWQIPKAARVSEGALNENIDFLNGQDTKYNLSISKDSLNDGDKIFFFAYQMNSGERLGASTNHIYLENKSSEIEEESVNEKRTLEKKKLIQ